MRLLLLPLLVLFFNSCNQVTTTDNDIAKVKSIMLQQEECWNNGDLDCFMDSYWKSDSLSFIGKNGINYGWSTTLRNYKNSYKNKSGMGVLSFKNVLFNQLSPTYIYVVGKWQLGRSKPLDNLSGHYTLIWEKINNKWLIVSDHSS